MSTQTPQGSGYGSPPATPSSGGFMSSGAPLAGMNPFSANQFGPSMFSGFGGYNGQSQQTMQQYQPQSYQPPPMQTQSYQPPPMQTQQYQPPQQNSGYYMDRFPQFQPAPQAQVPFWQPGAGGGWQPSMQENFGHFAFNPSDYVRPPQPALENRQNERNAARQAAAEQAEAARIAALPKPWEQRQQQGYLAPDGQMYGSEWLYGTSLGA